MKFGMRHPDAKINVHIDELRLEAQFHSTLESFMSLGYCIREVIRGVPRPAYFKVRPKRFKSWLRSKAPGELHADNVRFFPFRHPHDEEWFNPLRLRKMVTGKGRHQAELLQAHGGAGGFVDFVTD